MSESSSSTLVKRSQDTSLMPPPPPPKRQKRPAKVVDEDVYREGLSHIIARDYFPGLAESQAQEEYLRALDSNDQAWKREASKKLTEVMTPGPQTRRRMGTGTRFSSASVRPNLDTPTGYTGATPTWTPRTSTNDDFAPEPRSTIDVDMSLGAFQAKYTSEDNESFNALLDKQNVKRRQDYAFLFDRGGPRKNHQIESNKDAPRQIEGNTSTELTTVGANHGDSDAVVLARPSQDLSLRPSSVESFRDRQGPRNSFMFAPDSIEDYEETYAQRSEARSNAPPRGVRHSATRLESTSTHSPNDAPPSPTLSAIDAAIAGRPRLSGSEVGYSGAETPRVNGYAFVDAEPTPLELGLPVDAEEADAAEQQAAMRLLPRVDDTGPNPFEIQHRSRREDIHLKLVDKADQSRRKGGRVDSLRALGITPGRTPTPKFLTAPRTKGLGSVTPAGRRLAQQLGTPRGRGDGFAAWESTPKVKTPAIRKAT